MEKLLELARKVSDSAEVYSQEQTGSSVSFENGRLKDIDTKFQSGLSLRIIKDENQGFAFTKNLIDTEEFVENALSSLKGGVSAKFDLPWTKDLPELDTYDPGIESLTNTAIVDECKRIRETLSPKTDGHINIYAGQITETIRIMNSRGTDLSSKSSYYYCYCSIMDPLSCASIGKQIVRKKFEEMPRDYLNFILDTYNKAQNEVSPGGGKMKVLFLPETLYVLIWRILSATSGKSIYEKQSPISERLGEEIFDNRLTIYNDPLNEKWPGARGYDDEATPCQYFPLIEKGVLKNFYYDLDYANKLQTKPTGHGFKSARWGGDTVSIKPTPSLNHIFMKPSDKSLSRIIGSIDKGIIVVGALGAHSGNIPNGDFSIGLSPGLYVEGGEIVGKVKDAMVAGNIYDVMRNVIDIEDTVHQTSMGTYPAILFDNVNVATK